MAKKGGGGKGVGLGGRPGAKVGAGAAKNNNLTILLLAEGGADPKTAKFKAADKSKVRWDNRANRGLTLTFEYWPFVQAPVPIAIDAGKKSKWFDAFPNVAKGSYTYVISPDLTAGDTPPDPPGISFD